MVLLPPFSVLPAPLRVDLGQHPARRVRICFRSLVVLVHLSLPSYAGLFAPICSPLSNSFTVHGTVSPFSRGRRLLLPPAQFFTCSKRRTFIGCLLACVRKASTRARARPCPDTTALKLRKQAGH